MTYYEPFGPTGSSFGDRVGEPTEFEAGLGQVAVRFQELEAVIDEAIMSHFGESAGCASILATQLSFRARLFALGALARACPLPAADHDEEKLRELVGLCERMEDERNRLLHSFWPARRQAPTSATRLKRMIRKRELIEQTESYTSARLVDVADYLAYLATMVEQYFALPFGAADHRGTSD